MANTNAALGGAASGAAAGTAIMPGWGTAIGGVAGGIMGLLQPDNSDQVNALQQQAFQDIQSIQTPELQKLAFQKYVQAGVFTPEMESAVLAPQNAMNGITTNPAYDTAKGQALQSLIAQGNSQLTPADFAAASQLQRQVNQNVNAQDQSVLANLQARGQAGSGAELATRLAAAEQGAQNLQAGNANLLSSAYQRSLGALSAAGNLGSQYQSNEFGQKAQVAQAQNAINQWMAQNQQNVQNQNVAMGNNAQQTNLQNLQNINNNNTQLANQNMQYNNNITQENYQNQLSKVGAEAASANNYAGQLQQQQGLQNQAFAGIMGGIGTAGQAYGNYQNGQKQADAINNLASSMRSTGPSYSGSTNPAGSSPGLGVDTSTDQYKLNYAHGGVVPGHANVPGDSAMNDTVSAHLSPGEIVIPRSDVPAFTHLVSLLKKAKGI